MQTQAPTPADATAIVRQVLGVDVCAVERFPTGLCHYVYDVVTADSRPVVARLAHPEARDVLAGGIYWHERLRAVGVPLPRLLCADLDAAFPFMLLERLPGRDLAFAYDGLSSAQRRALARAIVAVQGNVATLPQAHGFGFARSYADPTLHTSWIDVVYAELERSRRRILAAGLVRAGLVDEVVTRVAEVAPSLRRIEPRAFLDDVTTKNVLIHDGALSGIVDTDHLCFGDPLFTVALTRMALLAHGHDTEYIAHWCGQLALAPEHARTLDVYTAVFCANFLGEIGQRFNQDTPAPVDTAYLRHLEHTLQRLLAASA